MRCLVTGGAGFIGRHLAKRLAELGHDVAIFDLRSSNESFGPSITYYYRDITQPRLHDFRSDWVFHLAALTDIVPSIERPLSYHRTNVDGTVNVLDHCVRLGAKKLVYASSTSVYGTPNEYPTPETASCNPCYPYALTKHIAEQYVMHWGKIYKLPVISLRITTAYGTGMSVSAGGYGSAIKVFMAQKAHGAPYTVIGDGSQSRDFVSVDDVVDAFIKAAESSVQGEIFNVGSGKPTRIKRLLEILGDSDNIVHLPRRPGEPDITWADITKIRQVLGWIPKATLEKGIDAMLSKLSEWSEVKVWSKEAIIKATAKWDEALMEGLRCQR